MTAPTPPDYKAWKYRATVRITNPVAIANYQHRLTLTWKPGMRSDFRDIRFTQQNGVNCPYWIETYTARTSATVWIKVPLTSQTLIFLYFGNGAVASGSSGTATWDLFDDFLGAALDTGKWTSGKTIAVSNSEVTISGATGSTDLTNVAYIRSIATFAINRRVLARSKIPTHSVGSCDIGLGRYISSAHWDNVGVYHDTTNHFWLTRLNSADTYNAITGGTYDYQSWEARWKTNEVKYYLGASLNRTHTTNVATNDQYVLIFSGNANLTITLDWIAVGKYTTGTEPTLAVSNHGVNPSKKGWPGLSLAPYAGTEYSFDPVNVDHTHTPGVDAFLYEQSFPPVNINHSRAAAVGVTECEMGPVNVYHARYPVMSWDRVITNPVDDTGTLIGVTVSRGMDDAMTQADFQYDGTEVGDIFGTDYMTRIQVQIPDYNDVSRVVFVGIAPSSRIHYEPAKDKLVLTAVDYGLYLTKNPLEDKDLALLPPANQIAEGSNYAKVLFFNYGIIPFQVGQRVVGGTSGATGTIIEVYAGMSLRMTLYPAQGVFQDDEPLLVGGVQYATADGRSMDTSYTPLYLPVYPEDWIRSVLGGDNWMRVTGIEPYRIVSSGEYWDTDLCPAVPFMFGSKESINDAMDRLAKYMKYIKLIKPRDIGGGNYRPALYWVPLSSIDESMNGLDLPEPASITGPNDPFLAAPFELEQNGDNQVDRIKLMCQDLYGNWLTSAKGTAYANAGEGPIRTFYDEPQDIATQTDLDALCSDLYDLLTPRGMVWHATLIERSDLEIYQLLTISGYGSKIPNGTYRIIKISHERACAKNLTHVTLMLSSAFSTLVKYGMTYMDSISEIQRIMKHWDAQKPQIELGTCTVTDGIMVTYETEAGNKGRGRDGTAVGVGSGMVVSKVGAIIVGAKIIIHSTRGGVICLPVVGEAATGTGLTTVGVPVIISAEVDATDHNYWFLKWLPGANNTGVSINIQTGSYPSAPGSVGGPGAVFARYTSAVTVLRIRFSGPSTIYYVKIWGESNGAYSTTGVTTTIESGADVIPGGEDPEVIGGIGVFDYLLATGIMTSAMGPGGTETVFSGYFIYNGTDNVYIGGPKDDDDVMYDFLHIWGHQPSPGYFCTDNFIRITGPNGYIDTNAPGTYGWHAPVNIKNLLNTGSNSLVIELHDILADVYHGCSDIWIRSYFGA